MKLLANVTNLISMSSSSSKKNVVEKYQKILFLLISSTSMHV